MFEKEELKPIDPSKYKITETGQVLKMTKEELERENAELKEQIEKMKCCENCCHYSFTYEHCYPYSSYQNCKSLSNWRLRNDR